MLQKSNIEKKPSFFTRPKVILSSHTLTIGQKAKSNLGKKCDLLNLFLHFQTFKPSQVQEDEGGGCALVGWCQVLQSPSIKLIMETGRWQKAALCQPRDFLIYGQNTQIVHYEHCSVYKFYMQKLCVFFYPHFL